jgi:L-amino acid N-acyltransferase YncA
MSIRLATTADLPRLIVLFREELEYQESLAQWFRLTAQPDWGAYVAARLNRTDGAVLVAEEGGALLGFVDIRILQRAAKSKRGALRALVRFLRRPAPALIEPMMSGFLEDIYVDPKQRRRGIAKELVEHALEWFRARKIQHVEAAIWARNEASLRLAQGLGFQTARIHVRRDV